MAPEVVKNQPYSAKVDIWSLGCTVIEMFTGKRPWLDLTALAAVYSVSYPCNLLEVDVVRNINISYLARNM
jgi:serine/threonine protein kinase